MQSYDSARENPTFCYSSNQSHTVAVWTEKQFIPLLTRPQGSQGCQKMQQDPLNLNFEVWCANMEPKLHPWDPWDPWDPWGHVNSGMNCFSVHTATVCLHPKKIRFPFLAKTCGSAEWLWSIVSIFLFKNQFFTKRIFDSHHWFYKHDLYCWFLVVVWNVLVKSIWTHSGRGAWGSVIGSNAKFLNCGICQFWRNQLLCSTLNSQKLHQFIFLGGFLSFSL